MKKKRNYVTVLIFTLLLCGCGKSTIKETGDNSAGKSGGRKYGAG